MTFSIYKTEKIIVIYDYLFQCSLDSFLVSYKKYTLALIIRFIVLQIGSNCLKAVAFDFFSHPGLYIYRYISIADSHTQIQYS